MTACTAQGMARVRSGQARPDLRHGCASFLLLTAQGVPARAIMEVLGKHSEIGVTMNTHAHVLPELRQEAADAIDDLFGA